MGLSNPFFLRDHKILHFELSEEKINITVKKSVLYVPEARGVYFTVCLKKGLILKEASGLIKVVSLDHLI
jgi:hypothetical protein